MIKTDGSNDINRPEITSKLSKLVEKRLESQHMYWSAEVDFDKNLENERRIDYVGFKPFTPFSVNEPASVELGNFEFYEVKSGMNDFKSGHGLTYYGDKNYLVTTQEFAEELRTTQNYPENVTSILCPDKNWTRLYTKINLNGYMVHRTRSSSEILWAIVQAHEKDTRTLIRRFGK